MSEFDAVQDDGASRSGCSFLHFAFGNTPQGSFVGLVLENIVQAGDVALYRLEVGEKPDEARDWHGEGLRQELKGD